MAAQTTSAITDYRINKYWSYYKFVDANGDGVITKEDHELAVANMARLSNASSSESEYMQEYVLTWWNVYRGGKDVAEVPLSEVVQRAVTYCTAEDLTAAKESTRICYANAFNFIDLDKNGFISEEELLIYYKSYGVHDADVIKNIFRKLDVDGDGVISREEFVEAHVAFWYSDDSENGCHFLYDVHKWNCSPVIAERACITNKE